MTCTEYKIRHLSFRGETSNQWAKRWALLWINWDRDAWNDEIGRFSPISTNNTPCPTPKLCENKLHGKWKADGKCTLNFRAILIATIKLRKPDTTKNTTTPPELVESTSKRPSCKVSDAEMPTAQTNGCTYKWHRQLSSQSNRRKCSQSTTPCLQRGNQDY